MHVNMSPLNIGVWERYANANILRYCRQTSVRNPSDDTNLWDRIKSNTRAPWLWRTVGNTRTYFNTRSSLSRDLPIKIKIHDRIRIIATAKGTNSVRKVTSPSNVSVSTLVNQFFDNHSKIHFVSQATRAWNSRRKFSRKTCDFFGIIVLQLVRSINSFESLNLSCWIKMNFNWGLLRPVCLETSRSQTPICSSV